MPIPDLYSLLTLQTTEGVLDSMLVTAQQLELPVTAWEEESVGRTFLTVVATQLASFTQTGQRAAGGGFLDYSSGDWLTVEADQQFDVQRVEATYASGNLRLTNSGPNPYVLTAADVRAYNSDTGATFTSTTGGTLNPGSFLDVNVVADVAGSGSNSVPGLVRDLVTPIADVTCVNTEAYVGTDAELDEPLRERCRLSMARVTPNAVRYSFEYYALSAQIGSSSAGCTRVLVVQGDGTNTVYCASAAGTLTGDVLDPGTPLGAVDLSINENCVVTGLSEETLPAQEVPVAVVATVFLGPQSTLTNAEAQSLAGAGLIALFTSVPIGGWSIPVYGRGIFVNNIETAIFSALAGQAVQVVLNLPVPGGLNLPAVPMSQTQVAVLSAVTVNVQRLSQ